MSMRRKKYSKIFPNIFTQNKTFDIILGVNENYSIKIEKIYVYRNLLLFFCCLSNEMLNMKNEIFIKRGDKYDMRNQIKCPNCLKRLFDIKSNVRGEIEIKCPKCKQVVVLILNDKD